MKPPVPDNEKQRLRALQRYEILDSVPEASFDRITRTVSAMLNVPISLVSLVDSDRQWFKSTCGLNTSESSREISFCAHAIVHDEIFIVEDTLEDARFQTNPLVTDEPHIRFYAGAPLKTPDNFLIGTLCVLDMRPRQLTKQQIQVLEDMACIVIDEMELRLQRQAAEQANLAKSKFLSNMSHELRTPLNAIIGFTQILEMDASLEDSSDSVEEIAKAGKHLLALINDILDLSAIEARKINLIMELVDLAVLCESVQALIAPLSRQYDVELYFPDQNDSAVYVYADMLRLRQVMLNLLSNAVKYSGKGANVKVSIELDEKINRAHIAVADSGPGIPEHLIDELFEPFKRLGAENSKIEGSGIGLAITKELVELMGGNIEVESETGSGTTFSVSFPLTAP